MKCWLILLLFLAGAVPSAAQLTDERIWSLHRAGQEASLIGLESVHLRTLTWTDQVEPEDLYPILSAKLGSAEVQALSAAQGMTAEPPFLRLAYDLNERTLENGQTVVVYWVSLELVQAVSWTWAWTAGGVPDDGMAVTWSALHADVAADPETAVLEIQKHVASLGDRLAADIRSVNPVAKGWGIGTGADGITRCEPMTWKATRRPRAEKQGAAQQREEETP